MRLISHRGNINGSKGNLLENCPYTIDDAIVAGYEVEIDVQIKDKHLYLGHDTPLYFITANWLLNRWSKLLIHCKDTESLSYFNADDKDKGFCRLNYFWHTTEKYVLSSKRDIIVYVGEKLLPNSICVLPEQKLNGNLELCSGICSDFIARYDNLKSDD